MIVILLHSFHIAFTTFWYPCLSATNPHAYIFLLFQKLVHGLHGVAGRHVLSRVAGVIPFARGRVTTQRRYMAVITVLD